MNLQSMLNIIKIVFKKIVDNKLFKILITFGIIIFFAFKIDSKQILILFSHINYFYLFIFIFIVILFWSISSLALYILFIPIKRVNFLDFMKYQLISISLGAFTPSQIGETMIILFLKKMNIQPQKAFALFFINKIVTLFLLSLIGIIFLYYIKINYLIYLVIMVFIFLLVLLFFLNNTLHSFIRDKIIKKISIKYYDFFRLISDMLKYYKRFLFLNIVISMVKIFISNFSLYFLFILFGIHINFFLLLTSFSLNRILSLIPITISGLGILEGGMAVFLEKIGYNYTNVLAVMLLYRILSTLLSLIIFMVYFWKKKNKKVTK